jgi:hypothetical protein
MYVIEMFYGTIYYPDGNERRILGVDPSCGSGTFWIIECAIIEIIVLPLGCKLVKQITLF